MATQVAPEEDAAGAVGPGTLRKQGTVSTENMFYEDEDGVDKLTSCEQSCLPGFWLDSGVPPLPVLRWVFDPRNKYFNDNKYAHIFGNVGFRYFDERRKWYMGWATAFTVLSIAATIFGCFAISPKMQYVQNSAWAYAYRRNATSGVGYDTYLGLTIYVTRTCLDTPDEAEGEWQSWNALACEQQSTWWSSFDCAEAELHGFGCAEVQKCRDVAYSNQFGAFTTCAGLLFALMGCLSRIRKRADSNFQKIISCVPDTYGFVCLAITLSAFYVDCYDHLPEHIDGMRMHYFPGPGYVAYFVCWLATGVRVTMHWLVPVPGGGSGCCAFTPPKGGVAARLRAIARVDVKANVKALGDQTVAAAAGAAQSASGAVTAVAGLAQGAAQSASGDATTFTNRIRGHQEEPTTPDAQAERVEPAA